MPGKISALTMAVAVAIGGGACAMKPSPPAPPPCRVSGAAMLPTETGGAEALCAAIERAVSALSPGAVYSVEVDVLSPYSLAARIRTADGRSLPEQKMAVSDRKLTERSIERFARAIGAELAKDGAR